MTTDEAIKIISQMIKDEEGFLSDNTVEAHKMAIKALESNETIPFDMELFQAGLMDMSEGMTNRDVMKKLFPNANISVFENRSGDAVVSVKFTKEEWTAPYKAESEG